MRFLLGCSWVRFHFNSVFLCWLRIRFSLDLLTDCAFNWFCRLYLLLWFFSDCRLSHAHKSFFEICEGVFINYCCPYFDYFSRLNHWCLLFFFLHSRRRKTFATSVTTSSTSSASSATSSPSSLLLISAIIVILMVITLSILLSRISLRSISSLILLLTLVHI